MSEPFVFKNVRDGKPLDARDIPKMPPAGVRALFEHARSAQAGAFPKATDLAVELCTIVLRRLEPKLTVRDVAEDEDFDMVMRLWSHIQEANPKLFGDKADEPARAEPPADPK